MDILILGETTYMTRQFAKHLADSGHSLRYQGKHAEMQEAASAYDWVIRGASVHPQRDARGEQMSLQMAARLLQTQKNMQMQENSYVS